MRTIIAGGRTIWNAKYVEEAIKESGFDITEVVCGGATGIDSVGKAWADIHKIPVKIFPANWNEYGNNAGPIRNHEMAQYANDMGDGALILVWNGKSPGSRSMLYWAKTTGLKIYEKLVK